MCGPASRLRYSAFPTIHFPARTASPLHTSSSSCYSFLRRLLHSQPLTAPSCPSTAFTMEYRNPTPQMPQGQVASHRVNHKIPHFTVGTFLVHTLAMTALPGYRSTTKHYYKLTTTLPLPSHEEFQVSHLHRLPPCMAAVSFQITA